MNKTIEINARYYLLGHDGSYDVLDRALELQMLPAMVFANGTETECREWVLRNTEEPVELTPGPWRVSPYNPHHVIARARGDAGVADTTAPLFINQMEPKANAVAIAILPALLTLVEQYHKSFPTKESGKLIAQAKGWI